MSYEEKGTWVYLVVSVVVYAAYVGVVLSRADGGPLADVAYVAPLLWSIGAAIVAAVVVRIVVEIARPSESYRSDERDRDLARRGTLAGQWGVVAGALGALVLALAEADTFWIANTIYLGFVVMAVVSSVVTLVAYRRGV
jgi:cytochrome b561